jgi:hypothetical protein
MRFGADGTVAAGVDLVAEFFLDGTERGEQ